MIDILIDAAVEPRGKGRPRAAVINGHARLFTPKETRRWENDFAAVADGYAPSALIEGPIRVDILAVMPRPKRLMRRADPEGLIWAPGKPDADNIRKAVLDALKAWWRDDSQVVCGQTVRVFAEKSGRPRTIVRVRAYAFVGAVEDIVGPVFGMDAVRGAANQLSLVPQLEDLRSDEKEIANGVVSAIHGDDSLDELEWGGAAK